MKIKKLKKQLKLLNKWMMSRNTANELELVRNKIEGIHDLIRIKLAIKELKDK